MNLIDIVKKYCYDDYDDEIDGDLYDYYAHFRIPADDFFDAVVKAMSGEQIDERLRELVVSLGSRELREGVESANGAYLLFYVPLLIRDREGFEEALEVASEYPYFNGLECNWTRVMAFKKEDYVHPLPR